MSVGSVVFGPTSDALEIERRSREWSEGLRSIRWVQPSLDVKACNCIGPQPGETKCPCALAGESRQGQHMIRNGVTIDGVGYELRRKR